MMRHGENKRLMKIAEEAPLGPENARELAQECEDAPMTVGLSTKLGSPSDAESAVAYAARVHAEWRVKNERRLFLIDQKFSRGLTPAEDGELDELQDEADRHLDEVAPLPFERLEAMAESVSDVGRGLDRPGCSEASAGPAADRPVRVRMT